MSEIEKKFEEFRAKYHENRMARGLFYHKDAAKEYLDQQDRFMKIGFEAGYEEATASLANQIWCQVTPLQAKLAEQKSDYDKLEARCKELEKELSEAKRDAFNWQCRAIDVKCKLVDAEQTIERAEKSTDAVLILRKYLERKKNV